MIVYFFISLLIPSFISCVNISVDYEVLDTPLLDINHSTEPTFREPTFSYKQDVPYYDRNETLFSTTSRSFLASYGRCAIQCIEDLSCSALELCPVPDSFECRATTGLQKTVQSVTAESPCKQFFLVRTNLLKDNFMYFRRIQYVSSQV